MVYDLAWLDVKIGRHNRSANTLTLSALVVRSILHGLNVGYIAFMITKKVFPMFDSTPMPHQAGTTGCAGHSQLSIVRWGNAMGAEQLPDPLSAPVVSIGDGLGGFEVNCKGVDNVNYLVFV